MNGRQPIGKRDRDRQKHEQTEKDIAQVSPKPFHPGFGHQATSEVRSPSGGVAFLPWCGLSPVELAS